jgi:hypothetical protein
MAKTNAGRPIAKVAAGLLVVICALHAVRAGMGMPITVGATEIPVWLSVGGAVFTGALAILLWRESGRR